MSAYEFNHATPTVANYKKYRDLWSITDEDIDVLAPDMRSGCAFCGEFFDGTAREGIMWQRQHRETVHNHVVAPFKKRGEARMNLTPARTVNGKGEVPHVNGTRNSVKTNRKWTMEKMLYVRDDFIAENGRKPTSKDTGFGSGSLFLAVKNTFGGWQEYLDYEGF